MTCVGVSEMQHRVVIWQLTRSCQQPNMATLASGVSKFSIASLSLLIPLFNHSTKLQHQ